MDLSGVLASLPQSSLTVTPQGATSWSDTTGKPTVATGTQFSAVGSLQPVGYKERQFLPEGWRDKAFWTFYTTAAMKDGDTATLPDGSSVRVLGSSDWSQAGFRQFYFSKTLES